MSVLKMKRQDLLELYQLLELYERTYGDRKRLSRGGLKKEIKQKYAETTGRDISLERNPRKAGRKKKYTDEENALVVELYKKGGSLRQISKETGCSVGHVQDVIRERKNN